MAESNSYSRDYKILKENQMELVELTDSTSGAKVLLTPTLQGRVMTSTLGDGSDISFGWINRRLIESRIQKEFHNPFGGEERFWIGPEGGRFSYYFQDPENQTFEGWRVPGVIDNGYYYVTDCTDTQVKLTKRFELRNAAGHTFDIRADRTVSMVSKSGIEQTFGIELPAGVEFVGYRTDNSLTNCGSEAWTRETGMPCVWLLGMYVSSPYAEVLVPYVGKDPKIVTDYFGPLPEERLTKSTTAFHFKTDGAFRSKIGLPRESTTGVCGCYDSSQNTLSVIKTAIRNDGDYMNAVWGKQDSPFGGDAVNAYNDGPTETGELMGPFLEIETSSIGAALAPGETLTHSQYTIHLRGTELSPILHTLFGE